MQRKSLLLLVFLTFLTFANSLFNDFIGDDAVVIVNNRFYHSWQNLPKLFSSEYITNSDQVFVKRDQNHSGSVAYRPVLSLTYFLDHALWGKSPFGYHYVNLLLHLINTILVYVMVFLILKKERLAFWAALIFCLHPLKAEPICSIGYRADPLSCFFVLSAIVYYIKYRDLKKIGWLVGSFVFYFFGLFTKEAAIVFPLLILAFDYFVRREKINWQPYIIFGLITAFYLYIYTQVFPNQTLQTATWLGNSLIVHIGTIIRIFILYILNFFCPWMVKAMPPLYVPSLEAGWGIKTWLSITGLGIFLYLLIQSIRQKKDHAFFLLWFVIAFIPISNLIPIANPMAYRFMYLPSIGLSVVAAILFLRLLNQFSNRHLALAAQVGLILYLMISTMALNTIWKNGRVMGLRMVQDFPDSPTAHLLAAFETLWVGQTDVTKDLLEKGLKLGLKDPRAFHILGICYLNDHEKAKIYYEQSIAMFPYFPQAFTGLGRIYFLQGDKDKALLYLEKAASMAPAYATYAYLIQIYLLDGRVEDARAIFKQALERIPKKEYLDSLAKLFAEGEREKFPIDVGI